MKKNHDLVDVDLILRLNDSTKNAVAFVADSSDEKWTWLARQHIDFDEEEADRGKVVKVTMPEWLAIEKELV